MIKTMTRKKNVDNANADVIHRYITEKETETNWYDMKKAMGECPYDQAGYQ